VAAEIINLRKARKRRAQVAKTEAAIENRTRFGQPKAERMRHDDEQAKIKRLLDGHKLESIEPTGSPTDEDTK